MSEMNEPPTNGDDLRRHAEAPAEGPDDTEEADDEFDEEREHAETPAEG